MLDQRNMFAALRTYRITQKPTKYSLFAQMGGTCAIVGTLTMAYTSQLLFLNNDLREYIYL